MIATFALTMVSMYISLAFAMPVLRDDDMEGQEPSHTSAKTWEILLIVVFSLVVVGILATVVYVKARQRRRKQERRESGSVQSTSDLISGPSAKKTITINSKTIEDVLPRPMPTLPYSGLLNAARKPH